MADQKTGDSAVSSLVVTYYEKVGLERLLPKLRYYQFADKKPLPPRSGKTVQWYRFRVQDAVTSDMTELTVPTQVYLSADTVSATLIQRGAYAKVSDMLIMTAIDPILQDAATQMGEKAARTLDTYIRDSLGLFVADHASRSSITLARWGTGTMNSTGITARLWTVSPDGTTGDGYPMLQNNTRVSQSSTVASLTTSSLTVKNVQHAAQFLRNRNVDPMDDGLYVGIIHPIAAYDLMTASGWKGWQKYSSPELMYKGRQRFCPLIIQLYAGKSEYMEVLLMRKSDIAENQQERFNELSWLGGIIDGEGSITLVKDVHRKNKCVHPRIVIANTSQVMMDKVIEILKKYHIAYYVRVRKSRKGYSVKRFGKPYLPLTEVRINGFKRLKRVIPLIKPHLVSKSEKLDILENLIDSRLNKVGYNTTYDENERNLCLKLWKLNGNYSMNMDEFIKNPQRLYAEHAVA